MFKTSLIVCGILAAVSLTKTSAFAGLNSVDAANEATAIASNIAAVNATPVATPIPVAETGQVFHWTNPTDANQPLHSGGINWMNHLAGVEKVEPLTIPTVSTASIMVPSPVSALLLLAGASVTFGGRRRQPGFTSRRETPRFKVVTNRSTRAEACMVRFNSGVLARRSNPLLAQA